MRTLCALICFLAAMGCRGTSSADSELLIFAAASLRDAFTELAPIFEQRTGISTRFNFAGSNVLAQQIAAAPRADVFASANEAWMDFLAEKDQIASDSRRVFLSNRLVVIAPAASPWTLGALSELPALPFRFFALADPQAVPAGIYARQALEQVQGENGSVWTDVTQRVVPAADVRAALAMIAAREDAVGMVYRSDVAAAPGRVRVLLTVAPEQAPEIRYSVAVIKASKKLSAARQFVDFLTTEAAQSAFRRVGFEPMQRSAEHG